MTAKNICPIISRIIFPMLHSSNCNFFIKPKISTSFCTTSKKVTVNTAVLKQITKLNSSNKSENHHLSLLQPRVNVGREQKA